MIKKILLITALQALSLLAAPQITEVTVDPAFLHTSAGGIMGQVAFKVDPDATDSLFVSLEILPAAGGPALTLTSVDGDVGDIQSLSAATQRRIYFTVGSAPLGQYVARITAEAVISPAMQKANAIVAAASQSDMVRMFSGDGNFFETPGISAGGFTMPMMRSQDGPHGYNKRYNNKATCFLTDGGLACTWDPNIAYLQGQAIGEEFRAFDRNCNLGPAMNIVWHQQLGRAFEYYSEDSYLSGKMAAASVRGLQSKGVIATIKHYVCNNMENNRANLSGQIDERSLRELFLPQFRKAVVEGRSLGLMTAYNAVNGVFCTGSKYLMQDVLRDTWGFKGVSMSDWDARVTDLDVSAQYGADILLPNRNGYTDALFSSHDISFTQKHARNIIYANAKLGALEPGYSRQAYQDKLNSAEHQALVRQNGAKALVLAKNDGNVLPIPKSGVKIFLTGPEIDATRLGGGDTFDWESSLVDAFRRISPSQGLKEIGSGNTFVNNAFEADYIIVAVGVHGEGEGMDRQNPNVDNDAAVTEAMAVNPAKTIVLFTGGSAALPGNWSNAPAVLICFGPGQEQGYSIADVVYGDVNPGGKLNATFPANISQAVHFAPDGLQLHYPAAHEAHGYFKVNAMEQAPLFAFGHGLSYTTFGYSNLSIFPAEIKKGDRVYVSVDVTNTGAVAGDEVVQLYLSLPAGNVPVRKQDLRGFQRISLQPAETKKVTLTLDYDDMAYWQVGGAEFDGTGKWEVLSGAYGVRVGTSSAIHPAPAQPSIAGTYTVQ